MNKTLAALVLLALSATSAHARDWTMDPKAGHLRFAGNQQGEAFDGEFKRFTPKIAFDAGKPQETRIDVEIDLTSVDTHNKERDDTLATPDFFWTSKFPKAHFKTTSCRAAAGRTECDAELTIRDKTKKIAFPFTFSENAGKASLKAEVELNRIDFNVGGGEWADDGTLAHKVKVSVDLSLL